MIVYQNYTTESGAERVKAFSDKNVYIERDDVEYTDADDFAYQNRVYTETDIPVEAEATTETDLTVSDTLEMLNELGVETDDK